MKSPYKMLDLNKKIQTPQLLPPSKGRTKVPSLTSNEIPIFHLVLTPFAEMPNLTITTQIGSLKEYLGYPFSHILVSIQINQRHHVMSLLPKFEATS